LIEPFPKLGSFRNKLRKTGQKPGFSHKFKVAFPKTEVLEKPRLSLFLGQNKAKPPEKAIFYSVYQKNLAAAETCWPGFTVLAVAVNRCYVTKSAFLGRFKE
jgi:hypothetical protein